MNGKNRPTISFDSSWDDARRNDLQLAQILKQYKLPATFYIPGNNELSDDELLKLSKDFEIGGHTMTHPMDLKLLSDESLKWEIDENRRSLQALTGQKIEKFCYPRGRYDKRVMDVVTECGYKYARTTMVMHTRWAHHLMVPTSVQVNSVRREYSGRTWDEVAHEMCIRAISGGVFHIWGHSHEIERDQQWGELNEFFSWLKEHFNLIV